MWTTRLISLSFALLGVMAIGTTQATSSSSHTGTVQGMVVDVDGKPLQGARVYVGTIAKSNYATTNEAGRFVLEGVPPGDVGLNAYKASDGYPYNMFSFFITPGQLFPRIHVAAGETVSNVVIRLGAKAAYLDLEITDEQGIPIDAWLAFSRSDMPGHSGDYRTSTHSKASLMVPPVPFRLTAGAQGFESWHYGADDWETDRGLISLKSGETLNLSIHLRRIDK